MGRTGGEISLEQSHLYEDALYDIANREFNKTNLPIMAQMDFGHTDPMFIWPYGAKAKLDCPNKDFFLLESAVI